MLFVKDTSAALQKLVEQRTNLTVKIRVLGNTAIDENKVAIVDLAADIQNLKRENEEIQSVLNNL